MNADDPRHGTDKGYGSGCRLACCRAAHTAAMRRWRAGGSRSVIVSRGAVRRVQALIVLGHSIESISAECGRSEDWARWVLKSDRIRPETAELVDGAYRRLCMTVPTGTCADNRRRKALEEGWVPPLAWDDIDLDDAPATCEPDKGLIDEVAVQRALGGDCVTLTRAERIELVARCVAQGKPLRPLETVLGINPHRYLKEAS